MAYYLVPAKQKNIDKSIKKSINIYLEKSYEKNIFAWAITNNNKCKSYASQIRKGDKLFIYATGDSENALYITTVIDKLFGKNLPLQIWGDESNPQYSCTILLDKENIIQVSRKNILKKLDYKRLQGITKLSDEREKKLRELIGNVAISSDINVETTQDEYTMIEDKLCNCYWSNNSDFEFTLSFSNKEAKKTQNKKGLIKSKKVPKKGRENIPKKIVGLTGEKIFFYIFRDLDEGLKIEIAEKLKLPKLVNIDIKWFNEGVDIKNKNFEDCSVGKGYDMELVANLDYKLEFEIKSSLESMSIINFTRNELIEMKTTKSNYIIVLVDQILTKPRIRFISNLSELFIEECINLIKEISVYVNEVPKKYFF